MNNNGKYRAWKERQPPLAINPDFSSDVMRRIHQLEEIQTHRRRNWLVALECLYRNQAFQSAALAVAAAIGLLRFWLMFSIILGP
jgi:hypothetical protein